MLEQPRLQQLLSDLAERDARGHPYAVYRCVEHALGVLVDCGFVPEHRSLAALNAVEMHIRTGLGEEVCHEAAHTSQGDAHPWDWASMAVRVTISFNRAASCLARTVSDYDLYEPDHPNILMAIDHARLAANLAARGVFVGHEDEWQEWFLASYPNAERDRLRISLLAG